MTSRFQSPCQRQPSPSPSYGAPIAISVTSDRRFPKTRYLDPGLSISYLLLTAEAQGLGTCPIGLITASAADIADVLSIPQNKETEVIGYFPCLLFYCQVFHALLGLLGLLFVACDFRTTLLLSNTPTATIAFLVCHFPSPPFCGLRLQNSIFFIEKFYALIKYFSNH